MVANRPFSTQLVRLSRSGAISKQRDPFNGRCQIPTVFRPTIGDSLTIVHRSTTTFHQRHRQC